MHRRISALALLAAATFALACAGGDADADTVAADSAAVAPTGGDGPAATTEAPAAADAPLAESDLAAYRRGLEAELAAVDSAIARRTRARTADDSLSAQYAALPMETADEGAGAAGLSVDRYRELVTRIDNLLAERATAGMVGNIMAGVDTSALPAEARARVREQMAEATARSAAAESTALASMAPAAVEAMRRQAPVLDSLRLTLAGMRVRAAQ